VTAELALTRPEHTLTMDSLRAQMEAAKRWVDSGLLPAAIKTPQQALTIMSVGREIGVPATYALRNIHVISGRPTCSAELLMALVRHRYGPSAIRVAEATNESCTVEYREAGWDGVSSQSFTMADARQANLAGKDTWKAYPRAMLRSRAVSEVVRMAFPECIAGLYTAEELGARVRVTAEGAVELDPDVDAVDSRAPQGPHLAVVDAAPEDATARVLLTPDEVTQWLRAWFGTVKGSSLASDTARAAFCRDWTIGWPESERTDSLRHLFSMLTAEEAAELLDHVTALVDAERAEAMAAAAQELGAEV
jgi:hypothetical protein